MPCVLFLTFCVLFLVSCSGYAFPCDASICHFDPNVPCRCCLRFGPPGHTRNWALLDEQSIQRVVPEELFRKFGGVFVEVYETVSGDMWEVSGGNMKDHQPRHKQKQSRNIGGAMPWRRACTGHAAWAAKGRRRATCGAPPTRGSAARRHAGGTQRGCAAQATQAPNLMRPVG